MVKINVKTDKYDYTITFNNNTMSMTSTHSSTVQLFNFENISIHSAEKAIDRFKFLMKLRDENIIEWNETTI